MLSAQSFLQGRTSDDPRLPDHWSSTENVAWKADIPGLGWASPVVAGNRIFITTVISATPEEKPSKGLYLPGSGKHGERKASPIEHRWMVYAIDFKTGRVIWEREVKRGPAPSHHAKNSMASETPVTDGKRVYAAFGNVGLFCFDLEGKLLWKQDWEPKRTHGDWGPGASPVLYKGRLYVVNDNEDHSFLMAVEASSGKTLWSVDRDETTSWASPFVWENEKRTEIVTAAGKSVRSYSLDGKLLWSLGPLTPFQIPTPFGNRNFLYLASGWIGGDTRPVYAIRPGASGDISSPRDTLNEFIAWYLPQEAPYITTPLVYGDYFYTLYDKGFFTCRDARTGKEVYGKQRVDPEASGFTASPWAYNGKIFLLSEDGDTFVVQAGPEYKLLAKNSLDDMVMSTPAIVQGSLIIRTSSSLYRIARH
jgi:outer membrane protein assembly factor BamB